MNGNQTIVRGEAASGSAGSGASVTVIVAVVAGVATLVVIAALAVLFARRRSGQRVALADQPDSASQARMSSFATNPLYMATDAFFDTTSGVYAVRYEDFETTHSSNS